MRLSGCDARGESGAQIIEVVPVGLPFAQEQQIRQRGTVARLEPQRLFARVRCSSEIAFAFFQGHALIVERGRRRAARLTCNAVIKGGLGVAELAQCLFDLRLQTGCGDVLGYHIQKVAGDGERLLESVLRLEGKGEVVVARDMARLEHEGATCGIFGIDGIASLEQDSGEVVPDFRLPIVPTQSLAQRGNRRRPAAQCLIYQRQVAPCLDPAAVNLERSLDA